jgi:hypothetical protein
LPDSDSTGIVPNEVEEPLGGWLGNGIELVHEDQPAQVVLAQSLGP